MALERVSTTFYEDFLIADKFGVKAIKDTYNRAFKGWKNNIQYLTEMVIILNRMSWEHHFANHEEESELYAKLYYKLNDYIYENFDGEDIEFYFNITD